MFALLDLSVVSSDFSAAVAYPGDSAVSAAAFDACLDEFERFVGVPWDSSVLGMDAFTPTFEGWNEAGDRIINCVAFSLNDDLNDIVKSTTSLRNAGR